METRRIGSISVPVVGMGTFGTFDVGDDELGSRTAIVESALDNGGTLFDSSPMYKRAEYVLSEALATRRAEAIIATKVWTPDHEIAEQQISASLDFYDGHVELFQIHNLVEWPKRLEQLEREKDRGAVDEIGATHWNPNDFDELEEVMRTGRISFIQIPYNPASRVVEDRILPLAEEMSLGVLVMVPLDRGALAATSPSAAALARLEPFGVTTWAQALLKWGLSDQRISATIPATSKVQRVTENIGAGSGPMFDEETRDYVARLAQN